MKRKRFTGEQIIDYYDGRLSAGPDGPANPYLTRLVHTSMLASEY
jgi:hypothetical protein